MGAGRLVHLPVRQRRRRSGRREHDPHGDCGRQRPSKSMLHVVPPSSASRVARTLPARLPKGPNNLDSERCSRSATRRRRSSSPRPSCSATRGSPRRPGSRASPSRTTSSRSATPAATRRRRCRGWARWRRRRRRVRIGTSVSTPTMRFHPSVLAQAFATIANLAPGRVFVGVGTGESVNEVPATAMEWPGFSERLGRLEEAVELMRRLWTRGAGDLRGPLVPDGARDGLRPPGAAAARAGRGRRAARGPVRRPRRRRLHHDQRKAGRALLRHAPARRGRGHREGRARPGRATSGCSR